MEGDHRLWRFRLVSRLLALAAVLLALLVLGLGIAGLVLFSRERAPRQSRGFHQLIRPTRSPP